MLLRLRAVARATPTLCPLRFLAVSEASCLTDTLTALYTSILFNGATGLARKKRSRSSATTPLASAAMCSRWGGGGQTNSSSQPVDSQQTPWTMWCHCTCRCCPTCNPMVAWQRCSSRNSRHCRRSSSSNCYYNSSSSHHRRYVMLQQEQQHYIQHPQQEEQQPFVLPRSRCQSGARWGVLQCRQQFGQAAEAARHTQQTLLQLVLSKQLQSTPPPPTCSSSSNRMSPRHLRRHLCWERGHSGNTSCLCSGRQAKEQQQQL